MSLQKDLGLKFPLIVAPMAGGPSTPELAAASCEAGALGSLGLAYSSPSVIAEQAAKMRTQTSRLYGMNLFVPASPVSVSDEQFRKAVDATASYRAEMSLPAPLLRPPFEENFEEQFAEVLRARPGVVSYVFGRLRPELVREAKAAGQMVIGTATTIDEALLLEEDGVDAIVLQGVEAGGHRGIFDATAADPALGTFELLKQAQGKLRRPIIAAGGLMRKDQITEALRLGAALVQMGTAFLAVKEAGTSRAYRERLLAGDRQTKTTRAFSGRLARGLKNRLMLDLEANADAILPYPVQNKFTRDIRAAFAKAGSGDALSLWCGTGEGELAQSSCTEFIKTLF